MQPLYTHTPLVKCLAVPLVAALFCTALWFTAVHSSLAAQAPPNSTAVPTIQATATPVRIAQSTADPVISRPISIGRPVQPVLSPAPFVQRQSVAVAAAPALVVTKTVGTERGECATTDVITITADQEVIYCYFVVNTGSVTFTRQTVVDDPIGTLLSNYPFTLTPPAQGKPAALFTVPQMVTQTTTNVVTWTGSAADSSANVTGVVTSSVATDSATVHVVSIAVTKTVGTERDSCAATNSITVTQNTPVYYCYEVANLSPLTLPLHTAVDSELGTVIENLDYPLGPGDRFNTVEAGLIISDTELGAPISTLTWTAFIPGGLAPFATALATVRVPAIAVTKTVGTDYASCAAQSLLTVLERTEVVNCYTVTNTGGVHFSAHRVLDSDLGVLLDNAEFPLAPGATARFTATQVLTQASESEVSWTAIATEQMVSGATRTLTATARNTAAISVTPSAAFTAIVFADSDGNGEQRGSELGLTGATVYLTPRLDSEAGAVISNTTDYGGQVVFDGLAPGIYTVTVDVVWPGGAVELTTNNLPRQVELGAGEVQSERFGFLLSQRLLLPLIQRAPN